MKDSGLDTIGKVPVEWEQRRLKYLCRVQTGDEDTQNANPDGQYPFYVRSPIKERCDRFSFEGEGILVAGDGAGAGRIFHHAFGRYAVHQRVYRLSDFSFSSRFLFYWLSLLFPNEMDKGSAQSTVPSMRLPMLLNFNVFLPPLKEAGIIAEFLDSKCSEIGAIVKDIQAEISTLEEYKKSIICEAVTKGLDSNVELKDSGIAWVGKCPEHWKITKIKYSVTLRTEKALFYPEKNKYIGLENIEGWSNTLISTDTEYEHTFYSICRQGDVMYNKLRPNLGKVVIAPYDAFCTGELMIFPTFNGDKRFLRYWMSNTLFITEAIRSTYGAKMPRVNPDFILNMSIFLPDEEEQAFISNYLDKVCDEIDSTISDKLEQLSVLEEYKKSLIYEYVTGKKEVPTL